MKKKLLAAFVALAAMVCVFATSALAMDVTYTNGNVNLRLGPGINYGVITVIPSGAQVYVEVPDTGSGWTQVDYGNYTGYVSSKYLGAPQQPAPQPVLTNSGNANGTPYAVSAAVNLRRGPGTEYVVDTVVPAGATVYVYSYGNGWANVYFANYTGYVSMQYIPALSGGAAPAPAAQPVTGTSWYGGNDYSNVYEYKYYVAYNRDVVNALGTDPNAIIQHFINYGMSEGRQGRASFNVYTYMNDHPDLVKRFGNDLRMYYLYACGLA